MKTRCTFCIYYDSFGRCVGIGINGMWHKVKSIAEAMDILNDYVIKEALSKREEKK